MLVQVTSLDFFRICTEGIKDKYRRNCEVLYLYRLCVEMKSININTTLKIMAELHVKQAKRLYFSSCQRYHKFMSMVLLLLKLPVSHVRM